MSSLPDGGRHRETQALPLSGMAHSKAGYSGIFQEAGGKRRELRRQNGNSSTLSVKAKTGGHSSIKKWKFEKHRSWSMQVEGFRDHVATDGSLFGKTGKWGACGWAVVQLDYDEEKGPLHGMYGSIEAEFELQRTVKRAELTAFFCFFQKSDGASQQGNY